MSNEEAITLKDVMSPELRAYSARVEALERTATAHGEYVEPPDLF